VKLPLLYPAWLTSIVATLGSLYFSEVRHFVPCTLCWYQRILMYPLVLLLGVATYRQDERSFAYTLPLSIAGIVVATYHVLDQNIPGFGGLGACSGPVPCNVKYINWLGFVSIPVLALTAFTVITALLLVSRARARRRS
jgi:disulfide bond formation protein DsbB